MEKLAYNVQKGTVTTADYIAWAHRQLESVRESSAILKLPSMSADANIFEVESIFGKRYMN